MTKVEAEKTATCAPGSKAMLQLPTLAVVKMADVPNPPMARRDKYEAIWTRICKLPEGSALSATYAQQGHAKNVRTSLKKKAKNTGKFLSTSHTPDGLIWYYWLEKAL
jgi:hypothetical protein